MLTVKVINKIKLPDIKLQSTLAEIAEYIIIPDIKAGIEKQMAINGGKLPDNEPATRLRKGDRPPLDDTGELKNSFSYKTSGKNKVIVYIDPGRAKIGSYLQNDGVKLKSGSRKYYRFFGISKDAFSKSMDYARNKVEEEIHGSGKRAG